MEIRKFIAWSLLTSCFICCGQYTAYRQLEQGLRAQAQGEPNAALTHFQAAVDAQPTDAYLYRRLGWAYQQRKDFDAAFASLRESLRLEPSYLAVYQDLSALCEAQGDIEGAIGWLESAIAAVPAHKDSYRDLARFYLSQERLLDAMKILEEAIARWPQATWAQYRLGGLYAQSDLVDQAIASFQKVIAEAPTTETEYAIFVEAHSALGNMYYDRGENESAITFFKKAIELNPADHSSMNNLAWVYAGQRTQLAEGIELSLRSLQMNPHAPTYLDTLAELYFVSGDVEAAKRIILQAISMDPDQPELRAHLRRQLARFLASAEGRV
jgi:tetratricopeptide (TPR) repeat protein